MAELLRLEGASYAYGKSPKVLNGLYLEAGEGDIVAIIGRNGAGKSTLFRCLTTHQADGGSLFLRGDWLPPQRRWRHIAWMAQADFFPDDLQTDRIIRQFISPRPIARMVIGDPLLDKLAGKRFANLSGGEKRFLQLLVVLGLDRVVTILDEPFSELAPIYAERMISIIQAFAPGRAVLVADHDWRSVHRVATRLELLANGRLHTVHSEDDLRRLGYLAPAE
jgi:ABC-type multidrug transport system ATPase subunit